jgi:amino acid adenylation domain-containing protein
MAQIQELFEAQVARYPDARAIEWEGMALSYVELNRRANRLAHALRAAGITRGSAVGICLDRTGELVVAMLAILKAGGAYVPLDATYPLERLQLMIDDLAIPLVITQTSLQARLPASTPTLRVDEELADDGRDDTDVVTTGSRDELAYVMYTSGSTGRPKGVCVPHRGIARLVLDTNYIDLGPTDRVAQVSNAAFDAATFEIWGALLNGAAIVVIPKELALSPDALAAHLESARISTMFLTTALFNQVVAIRPNAFRSVRDLLVGGDAVDPRAVAEVLEAGGPARLLNAYGPTETTTFATWFEVREASATIPIGRPIAKTTVYLLDENLAPVPIGEVGELFIGGEGVALGYWKRPELTAEKFVPDCFGNVPGARLYRTGDRGRCRADGAIEFLGRIDSQVKIRGFRIEPGEIQVAIEEHPAVRSALVVVRTSEDGDKRLIGYVQVRGERGDVAQQVQGFLKSKLPDYMVPSALVMVEAWPLNANGKIDRKALPEPGAAGSRAYVAPRGEVEERLAGIWADVLGTERVGVDDNFFDLGGHSLLAMQIVARVRREFGADVAVRVLFDAPSVATLARAIEPKSGLTVSEPVRRRVEAGAPRLSHPQQRLWFLEQYRSGDPTYNIAFTLRLQRTLDVASLERAVREIVSRHEILRTTYAEDGGLPHQVIGLEDVPVARVDLRVLAASEREAELARIIGAEARAIFDLRRGPVFRARAVTLSDADHVLVLTVHHIAFDGWSAALFTHELSALYDAFSAGRASPLPALEIQYADFAAVDSAPRAGANQEAKFGFWRELLADAPSLALRLDRPRSPEPSSRGARVALGIDAPTTQRLRELAQGEGGTLFMVLLAAFGALLSRYAGQDDVVVGSVTANRSHPELEPLLGFFVNTIPLRMDLSGHPTARDLLKRVRKLTLDAYENELPLDVILEHAGGAREPGRNPLFDVLLVLQNTPQADPSAAFCMTATDVDRGTAMFELALMFEETGGGLDGWLEYRTDLFDAATIERMSAHLQVLLRSFTAEPEQPVRRLALLTDAERHELLYGWNDTDQEIAHAATINGLFEAQVERTPDASALAWVGGTMTYRELNARANHLARRLQEAGIGPEALVGVCLERSAGLVVALLAALKAGGAYVPLDPTYPRERLAFILEDAKVALTLTDASSEHALPESDTPRWRTDGVNSATTLDEPNVRGGASADNLAYLIYTSGSTGVPKGVAIAHRSAAALLVWAHETFGRAALAKVAACTSVCFDLSIFELFAPLTCGGQTVLARDALAVLELAQANELTLINTVPSAMKELLRLGLPGSVRTINLAGEPLTAELADALYATRSVERVFDLYGPSEDTTYSTFALREMGGPATIGRPISNTQLYLLDDSIEPVPIGVVGEVYLGGRGLARGYFDRASLTAERFGPDPFGASGGRLYRTGDLARYLPDGRVQYLGRRDHQVKLRGFRIELGEIEVAVRREVGVQECVVMAREGARGTSLVGYVVPARIDPQQLRTQLQSTLPEYMIPAAFVMLDALPLTANGKLDRKALPAPEAVRSERAYIAPRTPLEALLSTIWCSVLRVERVGVNDNFLEIGGHSLLATQVVARVRSILRVELPVRALFESPTVARLAKEVEQRQSGPQTGERPLASVPRTGELPVSFAESRLWFLDQYEPGTGTYNIPATYRLQGRLDAHALAAGITDLITRHESLRTRFVAEDGKPLRVIDPPGAFTLGTVECPSETELTSLVTREARLPFDLAAGPLFRATLVRVADEDHVLVLVMHHIVSDGWSMEVLTRELAALYGSQRARQPSALPELSVQYADFAVWERAQSEALRPQLAYWKEQLAHLATLDLPTDRPRPSLVSTAGASYEFELDEELAGALRKLSRGEGTTLFMTLLAAFNVLLSRYSGQSNIVVGTPIAHRTRVELESVVGFFVNTLVLRTDVSGDPTVHELVARVREQTLAAYANQDVPFERLVEELQPARDMSRSPFFQVMFTLQNASEPLGLSELKVGPFQLHRGSSKFDLTLSFAEHGDRLRGEIEYATGLFDATTIERMAGQIRAVLAAMVANPDARVNALSVLSDSDRAHLLEMGTGVSESEAYGRIDARVRSHARRAPASVAIADGSALVTYGELVERANNIASWLRRRVTGRNVRIGVCVGRSSDMIVAQLAVLTAGHAYVAIDPSNPPQRIGQVLRESAAPLVLVSRASRHTVGEASCEVVTLEDLRELAEESSEAVDVSASANDVAYVIFTSGSTGVPKGVEVTHRGLSNYMDWHCRFHRIVPTDRGTQLASPGFDASVLEIWSALASGAALSIVDDDTRMSPEKLVRWLTEQQATLTWVPTPLAELIMREDWTGSRVRVVVTGGDKLHAVPNRPVRLVNHYGPTETTINVTFCSVDDDEEPPIGRPLQNVRLYVLDSNLELAPQGSVGGLYVGGAQVARGYTRPDLTADRFMPDPFGAPGSRMYRTGDVARWRADGQIQFLGRADHQVKIRGFRIELGEIEAALRRQPEVRECIVDARTDGATGARLVAYVAPASVDVQTLRTALKSQLPDYMIPASFVLLDALPLTSNGKIDRGALPAPDATRVEYVGPRDDLEQRLCDVFASVLGVPRVGVHDNFFELGGHSLLASRLMARIAKDVGRSLGVRALFELPTVAGLAVRLRSGAETDEPALTRSAHVGPVPLSYHQAMWWAWEERHPGTTAWNQFNGLRLVGELDVHRFTLAVADVFRRHAALRTSFAVIAGRPMQIVGPVGSVRLEHVDLASGDHEASVARANDHVSALIGPSALLRTPQARALLLSLGNGEYWFATSVHRILMDGMIGTDFLHDVVRTYAARVAGEPAAPEPELQYTDYSVWQRKCLAMGPVQERLARARQRLAGARALALPFDRPPSPGTSSDFRECVGHMGQCPIAPAVWTAIDELAREESTSTFVVGMALFKSFLASVTGQTDIVILAQSSLARGAASQLSTMLGCYMNLLVLRTDLAGEPTLREVVRREHRVVDEARANADLPASLILGEDSPWDSPLGITVNFIQADAGSAPPVGELQIERLPGPQRPSARRALLTWYREDAESVLFGGSDLFDASTIVDLAARFSRFVDERVRAPDSPAVAARSILGSVRPPGSAALGDEISR